MIIQTKQCPECGEPPEQLIVATSEYNTWILTERRIGKTCTPKDALEHAFPHMQKDLRRRVWDGMCWNCAK